MAFRFPVSVTFALFLVAFSGRSGVAFCVLGYGDSLECRFFAAFEKEGHTRANCTCQFGLAKQTFPPEQFPTLVDVVEAAADNDEARGQLILARLGFGAMEFAARVSAMDKVGSTQCSKR